MEICARYIELPDIYHATGFDFTMSYKEGPMTKNGSIDLTQSLAIHVKKSNLIYGEEKKRGGLPF